MPKLWNQTIETHRSAVREAVLATTATLVSEHGVTSVTMSRIAEETGIGRATLYKYFPDVESILVAWHEHQISSHLQHLVATRDQASGADARLKAVLEAYAFICHNSRGRSSAESAAFLHRGEQVAQARQQLQAMVQDLLNDLAAAGSLRDDVPVEDLAEYCLHALAAAGGLSSETAVNRLVGVVRDGLRPRL